MIKKIFIWKTFRRKCKVCSKRALFTRTKTSNISVCTRCGAKYEALPDGTVRISRASDFS